MTWHTVDGSSFIFNQKILWILSSFVQFFACHENLKCFKGFMKRNKQLQWIRVSEIHKHSHSQGCHSEGNVYSVEMPLMWMTAIWYHDSIAYDCVFRLLLISYFMFALPRFVLSEFSTLSISELYFSHAFHTINSMVYSMNAHSVSEGLWPTSVSYQHNIHLRHNWKQIQFLNVMAGVWVWKIVCQKK